MGARKCSQYSDCSGLLLGILFQFSVEVGDFSLSCNVQTMSGVCPASYSMSAVDKAAGACSAEDKVSVVITPLPHMPVCNAQGHPCITI